ncbi:colanic acid biosynthesis glycosyltransferase WcaL [Methanosarcina sp. KYL-1]|uniref:glycosyltransferase n=1 Tax=Methanosarcina sp. KYL-1 TaxID=2602068 RepID=UPI0021017F93|nr:glycosyltransferase [Methanosarcina sp. KYL-1]MCQ1536898.1 colanic acid biosynthesis glycosyltransferase WcaL [Methanosarcina sp. KYL-1]
MKVAYFLDTFPKISESFILNEITEQLNGGTDVLIFSMNTPHEEIFHDEVENFDILKRTYYFDIRNVFTLNIVQFLYFLSRSIFYEIHDLRLPKSSLKIAYFATIIEKEDVKQIHSHFANFGIYTKELSCLLKIPFTLTTHAQDIYFKPDFKKLRSIMDDAAAVVTISDYNKKYLEETIRLKNNVEVIRCGINPAKFDPGKGQKGNDSTINILTVSRLVEKKGIEYLVKAIPSVIEKFPGCKFTIIGSGYLHDSLNQLAMDQNVKAYIQFKGDVSDSELKENYHKADIFVLPCIVAENGDRDGIPVAMMEAMAMEIPVISTDASGIPELVIDGISGILVPQKNETEISRAIIKLCENKDLRNNMGKAGKHIIIEKYNLENEAKKLENLFQSVYGS